jgi:hypothetical protein
MKVYLCAVSAYGADIALVYYAETPKSTITYVQDMNKAMTSKEFKDRFTK